MALFKITRYTGELTKETSLKNEVLLNSLNEKALKRKQEFESYGHKRQKRDEIVSKKSKKNKKKSKDNSQSREHEVISELDSHCETSHVKDPQCETPHVKGSPCETRHMKDSPRETLKVNGAVDSDSENTENNATTDSESDSLEEDEVTERGAQVEESEGDPAVSDSEKPKSFTVLGEVLKKRKQKVERVLPQWLAHPSVVKADIRSNTSPLSAVPGIDQQLTQKLTESGIHSYFPVQAQVIPALLADAGCGFLTGRAGYRPCDICCSAPTGSGKTLAYVLPIVQCLKCRVTCRVRALVVLPVRDLALQVFKVFQSFCEGTQLKVGMAVGLKSFQKEQSSLLRRHPVSGEYHSTVDILVATPGRLVDHINTTTGFSLAHLRYLVIDEADRMMEEIKQDWLAQVERSVFSHTPQGARPPPGPLSAASMTRPDTPLQKLLFSATLSQNPEKLEQLGLFQPRLFTSVVDRPNPRTDKTMDKGATLEGTEEGADVSQETTGSKLTETVKGDFIGKYTTPSGLTELYCPCTPAEKPLAMLYFLHQLKFKNVLCFTNSVEVTHRLYWLIKLVGGVEVKEFSSKQHAQKRTKLLNQFKAGKIHVLVCSDAMARGMDVSNVRYVISYESAPFLKTYIHRVGRTARAGNVGTAITLLEKKQIFHFKKMLREAGKTSVREMRVSKADLKPFTEPLQQALQKLPDILKSEKMKK